MSDLDLTSNDLALLKAMHISLGDPELATKEEVEACIDWDKLQSTSDRVNRWPAWKTGTWRKR